jgi:16S rRNA processing protein RimM
VVTFLRVSRYRKATTGSILPGTIASPDTILKMTTTEPWVLIAHLVRPQGRDGELIADILTDFPERFAERRHLTLLSPDGKSRPIELEGHWLHKGRVVLKFAGIDSISDADTLRGLDVAIPRDQRAPLEDDSVYIDDLIGCHIIDIGPANAGDIGPIVSVDRETTSTPLLIVRTVDNKEDILIPFAKAYLKKIDVNEKRIEMALPEGLLTINSQGNQEDL